MSKDCDKDEINEPTAGGGETRSSTRMRTRKKKLANCSCDEMRRKKGPKGKRNNRRAIGKTSQDIKREVERLQRLLEQDRGNRSPYYVYLSLHCSSHLSFTPSHIRERDFALSIASDLSLIMFHLYRHNTPSRGRLR